MCRYPIAVALALAALAEPTTADATSLADAKDVVADDCESVEGASLEVKRGPLTVTAGTTTIEVSR